MKKIKINLAILAVILGTGMAFATAEKTQQAVYYNDALIGQPTNWVSIPAGKTVSCDKTERDCIADADKHLLDTGMGTLIDL